MDPLDQPVDASQALQDRHDLTDPAQGAKALPMAEAIAARLCGARVLIVSGASFVAGIAMVWFSMVESSTYILTAVSDGWRWYRASRDVVVGRSKSARGVVGKLRKLLGARVSRSRAVHDSHYIGDSSALPIPYN